MTEPTDLSALSHLAPELARTIVSVASDIALVLDADGVILNVALQSPSAAAPIAGDWVGKRWSETATGETRSKIEQLLHEATVNGLSRRREVNHLSATGDDIPVAYAAVRLGKNGPVLAVGRDLRAIASIQQRFVETQQQMEREYWQHRQAESRYRLLFQVATDAVMVVDAESLSVVDANRAAAQLFDFPLDRLLGKSAVAGIEPQSRNAVEEMLATARANGRPAEIRARIIGKTTSASISAIPFRSDSKMLLLVRSRAIAADDPSAATPFAALVERIPDAVVITDSSGRILSANAGFLNLCAASGENSVMGKSLADWVGDLPSIIKDVRRHGIAPRVGSSIRAGGKRVGVEVTATLLEDQDQECIGFTIRRVESTHVDRNESIGDLAASIAKVMLRVGREALPELVGETTSLMERHVIAQALERCVGDHTGAAQLLRITAAQLEQKLRQHGLSDPASGFSDPASGFSDPSS